MKVQEVAGWPGVIMLGPCFPRPGGFGAVSSPTSSPWDFPRQITRNLPSLRLPRTQILKLGDGLLSVRDRKLSSGVDGHGMGSLLLGREMWVDMMLDIQRKAAQDCVPRWHGLWAQMVSQMGQVSWHPGEMTQWAVAQYAAMQRGQWELPGGGFLMVTHPRKPGS